MHLNRAWKDETNPWKCKCYKNSARSFFSLLFLLSFDLDMCVFELGAPALTAAVIRSRVHVFPLFIAPFPLFLDDLTLFFDFVGQHCFRAAGLCSRRGGECRRGQQILQRHRCLLQPHLHLTVAVTERQTDGGCYMNEDKKL